MDLNLNQKNVLITGSSRGIGAGIAQAFLDEGANVLVNAREVIDLSRFKTFRKNQIFAACADVSNGNEIEILASEVRKNFKTGLDVLVCNVGSGKSVSPGNESFEEWQKSFKMNFFSATNTIERLKDFIVSETGSIICISSICGLEVLGAPLTYSAAKAALNSYVVGASRIFSKQGIRINAIAPGNILFEGSTWENKINLNKNEVEEMLEREVALKRFGTVEDVANVCLFLASNKAKFITGSIVVVDGGQVRAW